MGTLLRSFGVALLVGSAFMGQAQGTLTTYYTIPPTNGCDGLWAFGPFSAMFDTCSGPYTYSVDPPGCAESPWGFPPFWVSGDTAYSNLCSTPCGFQVWSINGLCTVCICGLPTGSAHTHHVQATAGSFPNPLRSEDGLLNIDLRGTPVDRIEVLDLSGRSLGVHRVTPSLTTLDLRGQPRGTYLLKQLAGSMCVRTERIVIR